MKLRWSEPRAEGEANAPKVRRGLFHKYVTLFVAVVCGTLLAVGIFEAWFSYREQEALLTRVQREQAATAAAKIDQFIREIKAQVAWTTQFQWSEQSLDEQQADAVRLMRLVTPIMELSRIDPSGHEQLHVSRQTASVVGSNVDLSRDPKFIEAKAHQVYYGPV
jgi:hypothetical protein